MKSQKEIEKEMMDSIIKKVNEFSKGQEIEFNQTIKDSDLTYTQLMMLDNAVKFAINLAFEQGFQSNQKDVLKIIEELKRKIRKVKILNSVWKSWFCGILDELKRKLEWIK